MGHNGLLIFKQKYGLIEKVQSETLKIIFMYRNCLLDTLRGQIIFIVTVANM